MTLLKQYTEEALKDLSVKDFQSCISTLKTNDDRTNDCSRMSTATAGFESGDSELKVSYHVKHNKKVTKLFFFACGWEKRVTGSKFIELFIANS